MAISKADLQKIVTGAYKVALNATCIKTTDPAGPGFTSEPAIVGPIAAVLVQFALCDDEVSKEVRAALLSDK